MYSSSPNLVSRVRALGVFSVPAVESEWFWWDWKGVKSPAMVNFMKDNYPPDFTPADFAKEFREEFFNASKWSNIFQTCGAECRKNTT